MDKKLLLRTIRYCLLAAVLGFSGRLQALAVVITGTGNPDIDVPAVQAAVDRGGQVILTGHFSFDRTPTKWIDHVNGRTILVSRQVEITGTRDENGGITTIEGGDNPFAVDAPGGSVTIQGLHFVRSTEESIIVLAASGLVIAHCRIDGVRPLPDPTNPTGGTFAEGIFVVTTPTLFPPTAAQPGQPENVSGRVLIFDNDIDVGGTTADSTASIVVFAVGKSPDKEVELDISGNRVRNNTERVIDVNSVGGRVQIERNLIRTGTIVGPVCCLVQPDAIHAVGIGSYLIAHNSVISEWATGAGIRVQGNAGLEEAGAIVADNDLTMTAPEGTVFGANSAAIEIRGFAQGNMIFNNQIRGRARAAFSMVAFRGGVPGNNTFILNDVKGFQASLAGVFIDAGVSNTIVVGRPLTVEDHGVGTVIVPVP
jgi:hypothetical protein